MDIYSFLFWGYLLLAFITFLPTLLAIFRGVPLNPGGASFDNCVHFSASVKMRLSQHYSRLSGTLAFWKKRAEVFTRFHYYCVSWTILSSWAVPIIAATNNSTSNASSYAKAFLILVSSHVALALSFHKGLKVSDGMKAFRHGESEFYDLYRRMLDRPSTLGKTEQDQIDQYIVEVERIRKLVRNAETESLPSIENLKSDKS